MHDTSVNCPKCSSRFRQIKWGRTAAGSQRYRCHGCVYVYTPHRKLIGHPRSVKLEALRMYLDGSTVRQIGRALGVNHQSISNWISAPSSEVLEASS